MNPLSDVEARTRHEAGLATVARRIQDLTGIDGSSPQCWPPSDRPLAAAQPLRLLIATDLFLVALADYWRAAERVQARDWDQYHAKVAEEVDQLARTLRFAINDSDTAQLLILIVAVPSKHFREAASTVFGPEGSRGDHVLRVVPTSPVATSGDETGSLEPQASWEKHLELDLQIVRPRLLADLRPLTLSGVASFSQAAEDRVGARLELTNHHGSRVSDGEAAFPPLLELVRRAFDDVRADRHPDIVASELRDDLQAFLGVARPSLETKAGGGQDA